MDLDGSGDINFDEFVMMMRLGGMETDYEKEINGAFAFFDKNGDGMVRTDPSNPSLGNSVAFALKFCCWFLVRVMGTG